VARPLSAAVIQTTWFSGRGDIVKMDGQATLYEAGNFLRPHNPRMV